MANQKYEGPFRVVADDMDYDTVLSWGVARAFEFQGRAGHMILKSFKHRSAAYRYAAACNRNWAKNPVPARLTINGVVDAAKAGPFSLPVKDL